MVILQIKWLVWKKWMLWLQILKRAKELRGMTMTDAYKGLAIQSEVRSLTFSFSYSHLVRWRIIFFLDNAHASKFSIHHETKGKWPKDTNAHANMINASIQCKEKGDHTQGRVSLLNQEVGHCSKLQRANHKNMTISSTLLTQVGNINVPRQKVNKYSFSIEWLFSCL